MSQFIIVEDHESDEIIVNVELIVVVYQMHSSSNPSEKLGCKITMNDGTVFRTHSNYDMKYFAAKLIEIKES